MWSKNIFADDNTLTYSSEINRKKLKDHEKIKK